MARTYWTDDRLDSAFGELRQELREMRSEIGGLRTEMHADMGSLRADVAADVGGLRAEMHREFSDLRKQALAAAVAIIVALIGVIGAVLVSA